MNRGLRRLTPIKEWDQIEEDIKIVEKLNKIKLNKEKNNEQQYSSNKRNVKSSNKNG